jgi:hypothetical protein
MNLKEKVNSIINTIKHYIFGMPNYAVSIDLKFEKLFFEDHYYLYPNITSADFSTISNLTKEQINEYTNSKYGLDFNQLCDQYRVKRFMEKVNSSVSDNLTIGTLVKGSGFSTAEDLQIALKTYGI